MRSPTVLIYFGIEAQVIIIILTTIKFLLSSFDTIVATKVHLPVYLAQLPPTTALVCSLILDSVSRNSWAKKLVRQKWIQRLSLKEKPLPNICLTPPLAFITSSVMTSPSWLVRSHTLNNKNKDGE